MLRGNRLGGWKFKRQFVVGPYIADFACTRGRLIVEADGAQHADSEDDKRRDANLAAQGFRVLRFWNNEILKNAQDVHLAILAALGPLPADASRRPPSPASGEGRKDLHA